VPVTGFVVRDFDEPVELHTVLGAGDRDDATPRALQLGADSFPAFRTAFLGREFEVRGVRKALDGGRLVTLVGPGGAGKTRLAVESVAADRETWVARWFADLTAAQPSTVSDVIRLALSIGDADEDAASALAGLLNGRPAVVILDNCEHVIDAAADAADWLLATCPSLHLLCTSREPLHLPDEQLVHVHGLDLPADGTPQGLLESAAGRLFWDRAGQVATLDLDSAMAHDLRDLVRDLDGLPLSIELVAAMAWAHSPGELRQLVHGQLTGAAGGMAPARGRPGRHATLSAVINWSVQQLDNEARAALAALSFAVPPIAPRTAKAALAGAGVSTSATTEVLDALARRSLIIAVEDSAWRLLESIRIYAQGLPDAGALRGPVLSSLGNDCLAALGEPGDGTDRPWAVIAGLAPTAVAAFEAEDLDPAIRQALALSLTPWFEEISYRRNIAHCETALGLGIHNVHACVRLHGQAARALAVIGDFDWARRHLDEAEPLLPEPRGGADWVSHLRSRVEVLLRQDDLAGAEEILQQAIAIAYDDDSRVLMLERAALLKSMSGDLAGAIADLEEVVRVSPGGNGSLNLANNYALAGRVVDALSHLTCYLKTERRRLEVAMAGDVAVTALTHDQPWTVETYSLFLWNETVLNELQYKVYPNEVAITAKMQRRAREELNDREQAEAAAAAAELDEVVAAELIRTLAQRRLAEEHPEPD